MNSSQILWRKSSHSTNGADCVEVGTWRKSSRSTENGSCVEVGMRRKSSHSENGGLNCIEVAGLAPMIAVRDSKHPDGAKLVFSGRAWAGFAARVKSGL